MLGLKLRPCNAWKQDVPDIDGMLRRYNWLTQYYSSFTRQQISGNVRKNSAQQDLKALKIKDISLQNKRNLWTSGIAASPLPNVITITLEARSLNRPHRPTTSFVCRNLDFCLRPAAPQLFPVTYTIPVRRHESHIRSGCRWHDRDLRAQHHIGDVPEFGPDYHTQ